MATQITYFVHATTTDNEQQIASGWSDVGLSDVGVQQAVALKSLTEDRHFDVVFCSDLKRAIHTAELTFKGAVNIVPDSRLRECNYGIYNAQPAAIVEPLQSQHITERFPDGESYEDVRMRMKRFLDFLQTHHAEQSIALVAHKAPQLALDVLLKNKSWEMAFADDWRKTKAWQPGWGYVLE